MFDILRGVKVVEVASFVFVPLADAVLADWGAEVIKVEPPATGDAYRGLVTAGLASTVEDVNLSFQYTNRGKRSIGIDLTRPEGRELLRELVAQADIFSTNQRPGVRKRLGIDVDDVRGMNPDVIYVRGSGVGPRGPQFDTAALDGTAYWARGGVGGALTPPGAERPLFQRPAFGDVMSAMALAGGVAAALYRRAQHGETSVVDVSLLNMGMWQVQRDILTAKFDGPVPKPVSRGARNPLVGAYRTKDDRHIQFTVLRPDPYWKDFCEALDMPELADDPRFATMADRQANGDECVAIIDERFAAKTFDEWCRALDSFPGAWAPMQFPYDVLSDPNARVNGYFTEVDVGLDEPIEVVSSPVTFDEYDQPRRMPGAPEVGQHTEEILLELGHTWDEIVALKDASAIT